jgi:hypothetical protein
MPHIPSEALGDLKKLSASCSFNTAPRTTYSFKINIGQCQNEIEGPVDEIKQESVETSAKNHTIQ